MKNCKFLSFLVFIILIFCLSGFAQNVDNNELDDVNQFYALFALTLIETNDIEQIPAKLFVDDFKHKFIVNTEMLQLSSEFVEKIVDPLPPTEKYESLIATTNFYNLILKTLYIKNKNFDSFESEYEMLKLFPPKVKNKIINSKWLITKFNNSTDIEVETLEDFRQYIKEMQEVNTLWQDFFNKQSQRQKIKFQTKWKNQRNRQILDDSNTDSEICEGTSCFGLPEKTRIHNLHLFNLCLPIAKINEEYKVVAIYCALCED